MMEREWIGYILMTNREAMKQGIMPLCEWNPYLDCIATLDHTYHATATHAIGMLSKVKKNPDLDRRLRVCAKCAENVAAREAAKTAGNKNVKVVKL